MMDQRINFPPEVRRGFDFRRGLCLMRAPISFLGLALSGNSCIHFSFFNIHCKVNSLIHNLWSLVLAAQHSFVPFRASRRAFQHVMADSDGGGAAVAQYWLLLLLLKKKDHSAVQVCNC